MMTLSGFHVVQKILDRAMLSYACVSLLLSLLGMLRQVRYYGTGKKGAGQIWMLGLKL